MTRNRDQSRAALQRAEKVLVGGVNSPVRAFGAVGGDPPFISRAAGATIIDLDGKAYVDYVGSWGPMILGHAPQTVQTAISKTLRNGTSFGAPCELEVRLAEAIVAAVPSIEKVRFTSSGTEAVMTALRLARGATGRSKIIKCIGGYHGHADPLLVQAGSGAATLGTPSSPGVPDGATRDTLLVPFNDADSAAACFTQQGQDIAAMLVEPVAGNMGVIPPAEGYLSALRELCDEHGALLVFDEVMTGFRLARSGAQGLYDIRPDLTALGKIIGGGLPVGAVGGPVRIMDHLAPAGKVYQAGTLSGNPLAMSAGQATLEACSQKGFYDRLEETSRDLAERLLAAAERIGLQDQICLNRVGSMLTLFFTPPAVVDYESANRSHREAFAAWFHAMLEGGIYLPPSPFEAMFVSAAHGPDELAATIRAAEKGFAQAAKVLQNPASRSR
jgi:glutamate-1-semialdehyde 2,1-aminomutase